ncbi:hypothetical protein L6164_037598 [Bauhinia variegata]|uniref:Uncharacterized protein n=1 Tax=Bauhinia variegata TaxID=167791 RepID=A0ACB9KKI9_BAUVA|nr:hypothetical protein L6164_037598 [Bauhinia variegata]
MQIFLLRLGARVCFWLSVLFVVIGFCYGDHSTVEVVGIGECGDCKQSNIKNSDAFSGLHVTIDCKLENGHFKTRGSGKLDVKGNFKVSLPNEIVKDGELKEECYVQLHSASSAAPCLAHDGLDHSKIVIKSKTSEKQTLGPVGKLKFSSVTCASAILWRFSKFQLLPKLSTLPHHFGHPFPPKVFPPHSPKVFPPHKKPLPLPPVPVYEKPLPPPTPTYEPYPPPVPVCEKPLPPPVPICEPNPPPVPVYEKPLPPPAPIYEPHPPPVPVYEKPLPPPTPIYKPHPPPVPVYEKPLPPPAPIYEPHPPPVPVYEKPLPPPTPICEPNLPPVPVYGKLLPPPAPIY